VILLITGLLVLSVTLAYMVFASDLSQQAHTAGHVVTVSNDGFTPSSLMIKKGDSVTFTSVAEDYFWPASNLHPTHTVYSAFDSKGPLAGGTSWSFVFDKAGEWKYHDHLNPEMGGTIIVTEEDGSSKELSKNCTELSSSEKIQCFDDRLEELLKEKGIEAAFDYFVSIYDSDPEVPQVCHGWAHRLGEIGYELYTQGEKIELRPEATFCSYGFFHGFINTMVKETNNLESALKFCNETGEQSNGELKGMKNNCIHGIGHSIASLFLEDPIYWGDRKKLTEEGLKKCTDLYGSSSEAKMCYDGFFHEFHLALIHSDYGFDSNEYFSSGDIFYYCHGIDRQYLNSCYYDFITMWYQFFDSKIAAMEFVLTHMEDPDENGERPFRTFGRSFIEADISNGEYQESVDACELTEGNLYITCVEGLASGFVEHGEPGKMHEQGFTFCREYYSGEKQSICFTAMIKMLSWNYSDEALGAACATLAPEEKPLSCSV
jgi:plastocyanin